MFTKLLRIYMHLNSHMQYKLFLHTYSSYMYTACRHLIMQINKNFVIFVSGKDSDFTIWLLKKTSYTKATSLHVGSYQPKTLQVPEKSIAITTLHAVTLMLSYNSHDNIYFVQNLYLLCIYYFLNLTHNW